MCGIKFYKPSDLCFSKYLNQRFLFAFLCLFFVQMGKHLLAQIGSQYPKVNIVSPTATSLGKYVDFPVSLHTGVPDINIPIYTVQEGPLQLPISLSYHASGLQVMQPASWVGAGWSLNTGGVVSRNVRGLPDDQVGTDQYSFYGYKSFSNYFLKTSSGVTYDGRTGVPIIAYDRFLSGARDGEPDLFTFNFGAYGGKFYLREDLTPILIPEGDLKIEPVVKNDPINSWSNDNLQGFKITTPDGIKYYFGVTSQTDDVDPIEKSQLYTVNDLTYSKVISSWYLYKIESADNQFSINISYRQEEYGYWTVATTTDSNGNGVVTAHKILISGVSAQQIQFSNGLVDFSVGDFREDLSRKSISPLDAENVAANGAKRLDAIKINSNSGTHCVSYNFSYSYMFDGSSQPLPYVISQVGGSAAYNTDKKRLKLNSLQKISCDAILSEPPYKFYYYDENMVPRRLSFAQDHWGFYNGAVSNTTMLPLLSTGPQSYYIPTGDERGASWPHMRAGTLRLVQYPTKGSTEYIYEANSTLVNGNCAFERTYTVKSSAFAGMDGVDGFGTPQTLVLPEPTVYYYSIRKSGIASGRFYIDNAIIGSVNANTPIVENYIYLNAGTHTLQSYAEPDPVYGSGNGVLAFLYEVNSICDPPTNKLVGGLRIKQITKFAGSESRQLNMSYEYGNSNLYSIPTYISKYKNPVLRGLDLYPTENGCISHSGPNQTYPIMATTSAVSIHPMQSVQGYHIGYRQVKEIASDGGYTINEYDGNVVLPSDWNTMRDVAVTKIDVSTCTPNDPIYPQAPLPYDFTRGNLIAKKIFNSSGKIVKEIINAEQYLENPIGVFGVTVASPPIGAGYNNVALPVHYEVKSGKLLWSKQTEITYDKNETPFKQEKTTYYNSNFHRMPTSETKTSDKGISEVKNRYVPDLTGCNYVCQSCYNDYLAVASTLYGQYLAKENTCTAGGCVNSDFKGYDYNISPCSTECPFPDDGGTCLGFIKLQRCRWASWIDYNYRLNEIRVTYTNCINNCKQNNNCISSNLNTVTDEGTKTLFALEQANRLLLIESASWDKNVFQSAEFLDYRPLAGDFAKVYLKDVYTTETTAPISSFEQIYNSAGTLIKDIKYVNQPLLSYTYYNGQPVELKERSGIRTSYIWGYSNTVPIVKAEGVPYNVLQTAYTNSPANFRTDASLSKAHVTSYEYDPIVGIKSITDSNGKVSFYEYDKLGRLIRIKDHDGNVVKQYEYLYKN
jgi:YD repeat-containing protein